MGNCQVDGCSDSQQSQQNFTITSSNSMTITNIEKRPKPMKSLNSQGEVDEKFLKKLEKKNKKKQKNKLKNSEQPFQQPFHQFQNQPNQFQNQPNQFQNQPNQFQNQPNQFQNQPNQFQNQPNQFQNYPNQFQNQPNQFQNYPNQFQNQPNQFQNYPNQTENQNNFSSFSNNNNNFNNNKNVVPNDQEWQQQQNIQQKKEQEVDLDDDEDDDDKITLDILNAIKVNIPQEKVTNLDQEQQKNDQRIISELLNEQPAYQDESSIQKDDLIIWNKAVSISKQKLETLDYASKNLVQNGHFTDSEFPPSQVSLSKDPKMYPAVRWLKSKELFNKIPEVFSGSIEPKDIKQGELGDCYFLSGLAALAEKPELIQRLFQTKKYNNQGLYCVWLCVNAEWSPVLLDDFIPCNEFSRNAKFSKANGDELWVILLEKAYAKLFGSYQAIEGGITGKAIRDLSGAPYIVLDLDPSNPDNTWDFLLEGDRVNNFICTAGSLSSQEGIVEEKQKNGIVSGHAYTILDAKEVINQEGQKERIIKLRNPWGHQEWTGDWSDKSDKWDERLRRECNLQDQDDGIFWMPISDFCKQYDNIFINYLYPEYFYTSQKIDMTGQQYLVASFEVKQGSHGYISVSQTDNRKIKYEEGNESYKYSEVTFYIYKLGADGTVESFVGSDKKKDRDFFIESHDLEAGRYEVLVQVDWNQQKHNQIVLSAYSDHIIQWDSQALKTLKQQQFDQRIDLVIPKIKPSDIAKNLYDYEKAFASSAAKGIFRISQFIAGYLYYYYVNTNTQYTLKETVTMQTLDGLEICDSSSNAYQFSVEVKPNQQKIVKYRKIPGATSFSYSSSSKISLVPN